ncbi:MAG: CAP domain-containing protein [Clostridiales bacterium]|nr:CAP domain-containing protein [Clostridiales bacterium]
MALRFSTFLMALAAYANIAISAQTPAFTETLEKEAVVSAPLLNIRSGPGMQYPVLSAQKKGTVLQVIGSMGGWRLVLLPDNSVGAAYAKHLETTKMDEPQRVEIFEDEAEISEEGSELLAEKTDLSDGTEELSDEGSEADSQAVDADLDAEQEIEDGSSLDKELVSGRPFKVMAQGDDDEYDPAEEMFYDEEADQEDLSDSASIFFGLVNEARIKEGLEPYTWDERLNKVAKLKANDMIKNKYFNHSSPEYGTPFIMLKNLGILYKTASENIAKDTSPESAFQKMMDSLPHRSNLTSARFNKMGVASSDEPNEEGKTLMVQIFIEE